MEYICPASRLNMIDTFAKNYHNTYKTKEMVIHAEYFFNFIYKGAFI